MPHRISIAIATRCICLLRKSSVFLVSVLAVFAHIVQVECADVVTNSQLPIWCIRLSDRQRTLKCSMLKEIINPHQILNAHMFTQIINADVLFV